MEAAPLVPAAQYVRMSTEDQQCSIANQQDAIEEYAKTHGFVVIATYADSGKSGVTIRHRKELLRLLHDVTSGEARFKAILVYDVSRFGRFQDVDEAAHYEFLCRSAGIPICYCAEQFHNDGSLASSMMKALKRTMAAEYSRELGVKVSAGQRRLSLLGYRVVGEAGYGLRRMTVSPDGQRRLLLQSGEHKGIKTDRTILVPGPKEEVAGVRAIFELAAKGTNTASEIANELNRRGMLRTSGKLWDSDSIAELLIKEKYTGCNAYGKTTRRLSSQTQKIPRHLWVTDPNAFVPIVNKDIFDRAQAFLQRRAALRRRSDASLIQGMKKVLASDGKLTQRLIQKKASFDYKTCFQRFGSMAKAYSAVGFSLSASTLKFMNSFKLIEQLRYELYARLTKLFPDRVRFIRLYSQPRSLQLIEVDRNVRVSVYLCRAAKRTRSEVPGWFMRVRPLEKDLIALVCTLDEPFSTLLDFYLFPPLPERFLRERMVRKDTWFPEEQKLNHLDDLCDRANEIASQPKKVDRYSVVDDILIATDTTTVIFGKESIPLGPVGSAIFSTLALNAGQVVSRDRLQRCTAGKILAPLNLNAHISALREKLGPRFRKRIERVPKVGYMYVSPKSA